VGLAGGRGCEPADAWRRTSHRICWILVFQVEAPVVVLLARGRLEVCLALDSGLSPDPAGCASRPCTN
jgi:hypothetical protein